MDKKIAVVTGASSKVMDQLIDRLIEKEYRVIAVTRSARRYEYRENVEWVTCNLAAEGQDLPFVHNADIVFHGAAISNAYDRETYVLNNYQSTVNLVDASNRYGAKKIVYISSILAGYEFGDYGLSKIRSEEYIRRNFDQWLIIRPAQLYGYSLNNPVDKLIDAVRKKKIVWCPVGDEKGLYPLYLEDMVEFVLDASVARKESHAIRVIAGPTAYTYKSLVGEIARALDRKIFILPIPSFVLKAAGALITRLKLRMGMYPDQVYRFYHGNTAIDAFPGQVRSISEYLHEGSE